jgi:hypothetical protein
MFAGEKSGRKPRGSVSAGGGLAGDEYQRSGEALSRLIGESLKNTDHSAISGKDPDSYYGHGGKDHHKYNQ